MDRGKYLSFEEARKQNRMEEFIRQHQIKPGNRHPHARQRFERVLDLMCRGAPLKSSAKGKRT